MNLGLDPSPGTSGAAPGAAEETVKKYMTVAMGVGLIPVPIVDMAALAAVQLQLVSRLAKHYEVDFSGELGRSLIASLLGGGSSVLASTTASRFVARLIPLQGWLPVAMSTALFAGASTYAVGKVFIQHFESGGTFLTFDPEKVRQYYAQELQRGREQVRQTFTGVKP
jgi:uncharacterized protein (DUF697 family)